MEIDKKGNLRSMFSADSRARNAYLAFSDVIVFDVTYRTNRFQMPFAPFTGVNHHRQSTLFGCALLVDERDETFTWLFEQWLKCMFGKAPGCIITDMDIAMRNAIRTVFPNTRHRFCSWHIQRHLVEHIAHMRDSDSEFSKDYNRWYFKKNIHKCEEEWGKFEQNMGLKKTVGYVICGSYGVIGTTLQEFVEQYDKALEDRRKKEAEEDFRTKSSNAILLSSRNKLEAQAGKCYTRSMFTLFQIEMKDSNDCWFDLLGENGKVAEYSVGLSDEETWRWCKVVFEDAEEGVMATCECAKFEMEGILCKHTLRIMSPRRLSSIPERYILSRWTIEARFVFDGGVSTAEEDNDEMTPLHKWFIISKYQRYLDDYQCPKSLFKKMDETLNEWIADGECHKKERQNALSTSGSQAHSNIVMETPEISIHDPQIRKTKGRPRNATRFKSPIEDRGSKWSELSKDITELKLKRLILADYVRFGAVCVSWRSAAVEKCYPPAPQIPWLMLDSESEIQSFYSPSKIKKAIMSSDPSSSNETTIVVAITYTDELAFCRLGDKEWPAVEEQEGIARDIAFSNGLLYAINERKELRVCSLVPPPQV
ncbi:protein FAR1-RELATED SEQUENCE 7-like [Tasmannia lanceolata]|uniref:protein FAR1-RELATED SEQUENCE 7-like n=1 Tax=Tasmannia lanceolata TaxID=3420 RepID=UPI004063BE5B